MKATEMMIGDWVYYKYSAPEPWQPRQWGIVAFEGDFIELSNPETSCKPIPLTPEILEKNGFRIGHHGTYNIWGFHIGNHYDGSFTPYIDVGYATRNLTYVHELQHALRLCGLDDLANNFQID